MFKHCCLCILFVCISKSRGAFNGPIGRPERLMGRPTKGRTYLNWCLLANHVLIMINSYTMICYNGKEPYPVDLM